MVQDPAAAGRSTAALTILDHAGHGLDDVSGMDAVVIRVLIPVADLDDPQVFPDDVRFDVERIEKPEGPQRVQRHVSAGRWGAWG